MNRLLGTNKWRSLCNNKGLFINSSLRKQTCNNLHGKKITEGKRKIQEND